MHDVMPCVMPVTAQTPEWPNLHAAEVRKLSTLLEISQALLAAHELRTGLTKVLEIIGGVDDERETARRQHRRPCRYSRFVRLQ